MRAEKKLRSRKPLAGELISRRGYYFRNTAREAPLVKMCQIAGRLRTTSRWSATLYPGWDRTRAGWVDTTVPARRSVADARRLSSTETRRQSLETVVVLSPAFLTSAAVSRTSAAPGRPSICRLPHFAVGRFGLRQRNELVLCNTGMTEVDL